MSIEARLTTLTERHHALESAIAEERSHAALDEIRINDLKRQKLAIKDQMAELQTQERPS
ncbi:MAG: YdcH family protein [Pseudomonadota bacterium]